MRIKTVKKMRLDELLKHVWHEGGERKTYMSNEGKSVDIDDSGIQFLNDYKINSGIVLSRETFTVEVEEIVTLITIFDELTDYIYAIGDNDHFIAKHRGTNIGTIIDCDTINLKTQAIYYKDTLIWSKEHGIPESGVLEVDEE